jgi:hypothetical protein
VAEGQINPVDPAVDAAPVLNYVSRVKAPVEPQQRDAEWRELADGIELIVPPPALSRQLFVPAAQLIVATMLVAWGAYGTAFVAIEAERTGPLFVGALTIIVCFWWIRVLRRLNRTLKIGTSATVIGTSAEWLTMTSPWLPEDRPYCLPRASITALRFDDRSMVPSVVRVLRLQVILRNEDVSELRCPWQGNLALADVERRFREALGLGPRNFAPPVATGVQRAPVEPSPSEPCAN